MPTIQTSTLPAYGVERKALTSENKQRIDTRSALARSTRETWARGTFQAIASPGFQTNLPQKMQWVGQELPKDQQQQLTSITAAFFRAYHLDSFEAFLRFRTNGVAHSLDFSNTAQRVIAYYHDKGTVFPSEPYALARTLWEVIHSTNHLGERAKILSVDLDTVRTTVSLATDVKNHAVKRAVKILNTKGVISGSLFVRYSVTPEALLARDGYFKLGVVEAIVRFNTADLPGFIVLTFYWSDADQRWIPWEFVRDESSKFQALF